MNPIDEIVTIDRDISTMQARRKELAAKVEALALEADHLPLNEADREGRQAILTGDAWRLPVIFESDLVMASLPEGGDVHRTIERLAGDQLSLLPQVWTPSLKLERNAKDGQAYRKQLRNLFAPEVAAQILAATLQKDKTGTPKSRVLIDTNRAESVG